MSDTARRRVYVMVDGKRMEGVFDSETKVIMVDATQSTRQNPKKSASRRDGRKAATRLVKEALDLQNEIVEQTSGLKDLSVEIGRRRAAARH